MIIPSETTGLNYICAEIISRCDIPMNSMKKTLSSIVLLLFSVFALSRISSYAAGKAAVSIFSQSGDDCKLAIEFFTTLFTAISSLIALAYFCKYTGIPEKTEKMKKGSFGLICLALFGSALTGLLLSVLSPLILPGSESLTYTGAGRITAAFFAACIFPPVWEELLYRGIVLRRLSPFGKGFSIVSSSFLFALIHPEPLSMLYAFFAGLFIGYAVTRSGSVLLGILIHFINNLLAFVTPYLKEALPSALLIVLASALLVMTGVFGVKELIKHKPKLTGIYFSSLFSPSMTLYITVAAVFAAVNTVTEYILK